MGFSKVLEQGNGVSFAFGKTRGEVTTGASKHLRNPDCRVDAARCWLVTHDLGMPAFHQTEISFCGRALHFHYEQEVFKEQHHDYLFGDLAIPVVRDLWSERCDAERGAESNPVSGGCHY